MATVCGSTANLCTTIQFDLKGLKEKEKFLPWSVHRQVFIDFLLKAWDGDVKNIQDVRYNFYRKVTSILVGETTNATAYVTNSL